MVGLLGAGWAAAGYLVMPFSRHTRRRHHGEVLGPIAYPKLGHGMVRGNRQVVGSEYVPSWPNNPEVDEYYRNAHEKRQELLKKGEVRYNCGPSTVFPNVSFHDDPQSIFVWHPAGPMKMEMWRWFFVDADAPTEVRDLARHHFMRYSGPGGMTEQDDMENWNYAAAASKGTIASRYAYNYMQGVGHANPAETLKGAVVSDRGSSEENARTLYRRWAQFMDADSWDDLLPKK